MHPVDAADDTTTTPGSPGSTGNRLVSFTVDAAGRITGYATDPVPVIKTDGSQPYTADQAMGGHKLTGLATPTAAGDAASKSYVDAEDLTFVKKDGSRAFTGDQSLGTHKLTNVVDPVNPQDAATKAYVDAHGGGTGYYSPLTNGDATSPALIFDSFGDVIMVFHV
jgi:hypothetical protein